jgi:hypothetical protein
MRNIIELLEDLIRDIEREQRSLIEIWLRVEKPIPALFVRLRPKKIESRSTRLIAQAQRQIAGVESIIKIIQAQIDELVAQNAELLALKGTNQ